jgi:glycosyltransferase involved in cell wall biosynthesis
MQGNGINVQRGAEEAVEAMQFLDENHLLLVIGNGDVIPVLKKMADALNLNSKVKFIGRLPYDEMMHYTLSADLGLSLDKPKSINYLYSLPNKIFDYIQAGCPILCSDLPEPRKIIEEYRVGEITQSLEPKKLADQIHTILSDKEKLLQYQLNALKSSEILCREEEEKKLISLFKHL